MSPRKAAAKPKPAPAEVEPSFALLTPGDLLALGAELPEGATTIGKLYELGYVLAKRVTP